MINVDRNCVEPPVIKSEYRTEDVIDALSIIFLDKCYLCESKSGKGTFQVDHFKPTAIYELEHEWTNLYLCCAGCNNFKRAKEKEILDPCQDDVENLIIYKYDINEVTGEYEASFISTDLDSEKINNTVELLEELHNREKDTKGKTDYRAASLRDSIHKQWMLLVRNTLKLHRAKNNIDLQEAKKNIKN